MLAFVINNKGEVTGYFYPDPNTERGFVWKPWKLHDAARAASSLLRILPAGLIGSASSRVIFDGRL